MYYRGRPCTKALSRKPVCRPRINQNFVGITAGNRLLGMRAGAGNSRTYAPSSSSSEEDEDFVGSTYASSSSEEEEEPSDVVQESEEQEAEEELGSVTFIYPNANLVVQHVRVPPAAPEVPVVPPPADVDAEDEVKIIRVIPPPHRGYHHNHTQSLVDLTSSD